MECVERVLGRRSSQTVSAGMEKSDLINFRSLDKELREMLEAERKFSRENDARFRALQQNVATYEEFRDIVRASHLKPLNRKDISGATKKRQWTTVACGMKQDCVSSDEFVPQLLEIQPRSASEFIRDWRRFSGSSFEKYDLLVSLGGKVLQGIFSTEVAFGLLGEFFLILSQYLRSGDEEQVIGVLDGLSRTGRFGLNLSILSQVEQKACEELYRKLRVAVGDYSVTSVDCESGLSNVDDNKTHIAMKLKELLGKYGIHE